MNTAKIQNILAEHGLKITPQRYAVLNAVYRLGNHPSTDKIMEFIKKEHPNIAVGTVYKILEIFVANGIIKRVKTEKDIMRYDAVNEKHHHLYCSQSDRIEDYYDEELNNLLENYLKKKNIENFKIEDFKLQLIGTFSNK
jgi:Fur family peroxide stress response transcriptional regulator